MLVVFILLLFCFVLPSVSLSVDEGPFYCLFLTLSCKYSVAIATRGPKIQNMMTSGCCNLSLVVITNEWPMTTISFHL